METLDLYNEFTKKYGKDLQIIKAVEELSELQKVLCKILIDKEITLERYGQLVEEIADVNIMLNQIVNIFLITKSDIQIVVNFKHKRMEEMLK